MDGVEVGRVGPTRPQGGGFFAKAPRDQGLLLLNREWTRMNAKGREEGVFGESAPLCFLWPIRRSSLISGHPRSSAVPLRALCAEFRMLSWRRRETTNAHRSTRMVGEPAPVGVHSRPFVVLPSELRMLSRRRRDRGGGRLFHFAPFVGFVGFEDEEEDEYEEDFAPRDQAGCAASLRRVSWVPPPSSA